MNPLFHAISPRAAGHGVRYALLALRLSAQLPMPAANTNGYPLRKVEIGAVRWLDLHCHLNAIYRYSRHQRRTSGPRSL